jgi:hypothetical protein
MAVQITDGEVSAIRFIRTIRQHAPDPVKSNFEGYVSRSDWGGLAQWAQPLQGQLKLGSFTVPEVAEVAPLSDGRQDVYLFFRGIEAPAAAAFKDRVDGLRAWGAWDSIAALVTGNPGIPFHFTGADVQAVLDPSGSIPALSAAQAQAKTFLNTVASDPKLAGLKEQVAKLLEWGGWESVAQIVQANPKIPFQFTGDDVRAVMDPAGKIPPRAPDAIKPMQDVWSFYSVLRDQSAGDAGIGQFFGQIQQRVQHGCWKSIADIVNGNDKIPFKGFEVATLKAVLDPQGQYGEDDACSALAPPTPPAWTKPIVWTMGAGMAAYDWTTGAAGEVSDWTTGAASSVADWTTGAAGDVASWTTGATSSAIDWTSGAAGETAGWVTGAAGAAGGWVSGTAGQVGDWAESAGGAVANTFNPSSW